MKNEKVLPSFKKSANRGSSRLNPKDKDWALLERCYETNHRNGKGISGGTIPKTFHLIWLGSPLPSMYASLARRWEEVNPGWEVKVWTDAEAATLTLVNRVAFDQAKNWGTKSDILRYEILYQLGGVYIDTDFLAVAPFDDLVGLDFFSGTGHVDNVAIFNGVIGTKPGNPILQVIIDKISHSSIREDSPEAILDSTGPHMFKKVILQYLETQKAVIFPTTYFYPFPATKRASLRGLDLVQTEKAVKKYIRKETYCVHLWYTSWQS